MLSVSSRKGGVDLSDSILSSCPTSSVSSRKGGVDLSVSKRAKWERGKGLLPQGRSGFKLYGVYHLNGDYRLLPQGRSGFKHSLANAMIIGLLSPPAREEWI